jgi:hypothetical protein
MAFFAYVCIMQVQVLLIVTSEINARAGFACDVLSIFPEQEAQSKSTRISPSDHTPAGVSE